MAIPFLCRCWGIHSWSPVRLGTLSIHQIRYCFGCGKEQWRPSGLNDVQREPGFPLDRSWRNGSEPGTVGLNTPANGIPMPAVLPPRPNKPPPAMGSLLAAGISPNQAAIHEGVAQGMPEKRVIVVKASSRCIWLDADGNVVRESDELDPIGLTPEEQGQV